MQLIVAFQGLGQRDWRTLYQDPLIKEAIHWGQEILHRHSVELEGCPLNLVQACQQGGIVLKEHTQTAWQGMPVIWGLWWT